MALIKLNNRGVRNVSTFGSVGGGSMTFIKKLTASSSDDLSFVNGSSDVVLDSTYKEYVFMLNNIHSESDDIMLTVNFRDGGSSYDATKTTTFFRANHREDDGGTPGVAYRTGEDLAQGTGFKQISAVNGAGNDEALSGYLYLFNPSSTTFVKHFFGESNAYMINQDHTNHSLFAGYGNTTSAVDAVQFKMDSGNIDSGVIKLYGIS